MPRLEHVYECQGYRSFGKDGDTRARPEMTESRARVHTGQVEVAPILAGEICCLLPVYLEFMSEAARPWPRSFTGSWPW
jgi:hypothetical protein